MSTICITHLAVLCNYAPCSDTCCIVLHVNSIRVIRVPYEYTVNWQQIPLFNFQSFRNYRRNHHGLFLLFSLSLPLSLWQCKTNTRTIVPWAVFLNRKKKRKKEKKKIKGRSDQGEICGSCLPVLSAHDWIWGRLPATRRLWEIKEVPCFALHTSNTINNAFSYPTCRAQEPKCAHSHMDTHNSLQRCLALNYTVCWAVWEPRWVQVDSYLRASEDCWKVKTLVEMHFNKMWFSNQKDISLSINQLPVPWNLYTRKWELNCPSFWSNTPSWVHKE